MLSYELLQKLKALDARLEIRVEPARSFEEFQKLPEPVRKRVLPPTCNDGVNVTFLDPASLPKRIKVEGSVRLEGVSHSTGVVQLAVVLGKDGTAIEVKPLAGPESLLDAAVDVVNRSKLKPTLLNGYPVEVQTTAEVSFRATETSST